MSYFADQAHNDGAATAAVTEWFAGLKEGSRSSLTSVMAPALQMADSMRGVDTQHSDAERFLNKPMADQVQALVEWFEDKDYERALYYLAVYAKDRASPHTDWPLNPDTERPELVEHIHKAHKSGVMGHGLYLASLSALADAPENAKALLKQEVVDEVVSALTKDAASEVSTVFGLKLLVLLAQAQPQTGAVEGMLVKQPNAIPYLMTVLQDETTTVFEARYPAQLLGCILRTHPEALRTAMNGRYKDAEGRPLTIFSVIREGCRFKDSWSLQYYIRLAMDCMGADEALSAQEFNNVNLSALLVGLLQNNWNYVELLPPIVKLMRRVNEQAERPGLLLTYKDFFIIAATVADKAGSFHGVLVQDLYETVDHALHDASLPAAYMQSKRPVVDRFNRICAHALTKKPMTHVSASWIERDQERLRASVV
eukprot:TRINITY_DN15876_c0_g1_i1.p1 TRINITY_DN15876_c0_g1~~TRINITY_DN15876_c0_g1_i1.p1  ORF type:complete len:474 (+),score=177.59 TRINITY_DN15876_c0_g1_i1:145-1422(+)